MRKDVSCEIVTIGTELLLGQIMDTNTTYLAALLNKAGLHVAFRTAVGDLMGDIEKVLRTALARCDLVIATGGLGPTLDDLTREAVAAVAGVDLELRQDLMDQIVSVFRLAGYQMPENNRRQAFVPRESRPIPNPVGTAPGFITEIKGKPVICLPGVPRELKYLMDHEVMGWLRERFSLGDRADHYRVLKVVGIGESKVDSLIGDLMIPGGNPEVGLLASPGEIKIRIAARDKEDMKADAIILPVETEIRKRLGDKVYGTDEETLAGVVEGLLGEGTGVSLSIIETFTGGVAALKLHAVRSARLIQSLVIPEKSRMLEWLALGSEVVDVELALAAAARMREAARAGVGLAILGFPEGREGRISVSGSAAVFGLGSEKTFSWQMGGEFHQLQERGALIGLNTLRLALIKRMMNGE
jgi:nicotinamide-nucleotide amidase